jgi:hypothetical protein
MADAKFGGLKKKSPMLNAEVSIAFNSGRKRNSTPQITIKNKRS